MSVEQYESNVNDIIDTINEQIKTCHPEVTTDASIILITPGCVDESKWPTRTNENAKKYAEVIRSISFQRSLPLVDLWSSPNALSISDLNDGLHFGPSANQKTFEKIQECIRKNRKDLSPDDDEDGMPLMEMHMPYWGRLVGEGGGKVIEEWEWK